MHATRRGRSDEKTPPGPLHAHKPVEAKVTVLRFATPGELCAVTGAVSGPPKSDGHFRIARYPKNGLQTILSKNYCDRIIQCERNLTPSRLCLGSTPRAKSESIVRILGASQRTSQISELPTHSTRRLSPPTEKFDSRRVGSCSRHPLLQSVWR
jgi:hypothetical protein